MADIKWIKITTDMFEDEKIRLIDAMPGSDTIHYIWIRLLVQAGKTNSNGFIFMHEDVPYTEEMLATIFYRPINTIRFALKVLKDFRMIEISDDNLIRISNWEKHQNVEGMDKLKEKNRKRVQDHRARKKLEEIRENGSDDSGNVTVTGENIIENECNNSVIESNVTVMTQREKEDVDVDVDVDLDVDEIKNKQKVDSGAIELVAYVEKITGKIGGISIGSIRLAISQHGKGNVKNAINHAIAVDRTSMSYINGILKNWRTSGYPNEEVMNNGNGSIRADTMPAKKEFPVFKPKKPKRFTDEERAETEAELI